RPPAHPILACSRRSTGTPVWRAGWTTSVRAHCSRRPSRRVRIHARMWAARCYATGCMGFEQNPSSAEAIATEVMGPIRELAMAGDPEAQFLLGDVLAAGRIVRAGPEEAAYWYRLAAESGHVLAARALGR